MFSSTPLRASTKDRNANNSASSNEHGNSLENRNSFPYPPCWKNGVRMIALLAPFRIRELNPEHYDSKLKFWEDMIALYCEHTGTGCFCKRDLQHTFTRGDRIPSGLDTVFSEMLHAKKIRARADFEYDPENTWSGWAMNNFVKLPISWGWQTLKSRIGLQSENQANWLEYVHLDVMKKFCKQLQQSVLQEHQGELLHYENFRELSSAVLALKEDCLHLCLHVLHCQRKIGVEYKLDKKEQQIHLIKIPSKTDTSIEITETDRAVHNLKMTQASLLKQLEKLEEDIKENAEKARQYIKENKRQLAKTYLRKKQLLEKNHEKRSIALHNIESLITSVDEAQSHGQILDAYKIGSKALQKALNDSGLKYDNVDEVIAEVRDTMETHQELQDTLANAGVSDIAAGGADVNDNDALERELQQILGQTGQTPTKPTNTNENANISKSAASGLPKPQITDAELLAMLAGLEVEDGSPRKSEAGVRTTATE
ncbi:PREDICTED: charged multivesicular body protein 7 [Bactrocera latifrons]|uniref:charged multivesicular body protein 7 n=1 Tax=Bactrocera latifrons TaxID=174628 RepID=UPI0008DCC112|nr:PREDICTED: charged multivesicular body protein 7 [Bactrocera latifrons]